MGKRLVHFGSVGIGEEGWIHIEGSTFAEGSLAVSGVARRTAQTVDRTGGKAKVGWCGGGRERLKGLIDRGLLGRAQPEVWT